DRYQQDIDRHASVRIGELRKDLIGNELVLGGVIAELREITTKAGKTMGVFQLEDQFGRVEVVVFPRTWAESIEGKPDDASPEAFDEPGQPSLSWGDWVRQNGEDP